MVAAADWLANQSHVITGSWDGMAMVFDSETGDKLETLYGKCRAGIILLFVTW